MMQYRRLGNAGLKVSAVSLGGWLTYGASVQDDTAIQCLRTAVENGVNFIDMADIYARGESERVAGEALKDYRRQDLVISSKTYWPMSENINDRGLNRKHIMESVEGSLKRLGTDYVDIYFAHRFDEETPVEEVVRAMDDLVHQGKVLYWGTSFWSAAQIESAIGAGKSLNAYLPQVEQPRYNMLDRSIEAEVLPTAAKHGMGLTVFSPLAQGFLTGKYNDGLPEGSRGATSQWLDNVLTPENITKVRGLTDLAGELGITMSQLALAWILRRPEISSAITGATNPEHVLTNIQAADVVLEPDVLDKIETILDGAS
jgi:voltage-dependent potassium channel beta subunit